MKLIMLIAADHAHIDQGSGKIYILGAFTSILAPSFPVTHNSMALLIKIGAVLGESDNEHILGVALTDEDGAELIKIEGPFKIPFGPQGTRPEFTAVIELKSVIFSKPGTYLFTALVDENELDSLSINLVQLEQR